MSRLLIRHARLGYYSRGGVGLGPQPPIIIDSLPPENSVAPVIRLASDNSPIGAGPTDYVTVGTGLIADPGQWLHADTVTVQWFNLTIPRTASPSPYGYTTASGDNNETVHFVVTATNTNGSTVLSSVLLPVQASAPADPGAPTGSLILPLSAISYQRTGAAEHLTPMNPSFGQAAGARTNNIPTSSTALYTNMWGTLFEYQEGNFSPCKVETDHHQLWVKRKSTGQWTRVQYSRSTDPQSGGAWYSAYTTAPPTMNVPSSEWSSVSGGGTKMHLGTRPFPNGGGTNGAGWSWHFWGHDARANIPATDVDAQISAYKVRLDPNASSTDRGNAKYVTSAGMDWWSGSAAGGGAGTTNPQYIGDAGISRQIIVREDWRWAICGNGSLATATQDPGITLTGTVDSSEFD